MSSSGYHNVELQIALDPKNRNFCLPELPADYERVLDVGCGSGQTLIALGVPPEKGFGVDIDADAVRDNHGYDLRVGAGESLPFRDSYFDYVICRVALPYMYIPTGLEEIHRVMRPGGQVWFLLHSWTRTRRRLKESMLRFDIKDAIFVSYIILNSWTFHLTGKMFRFPAKNRCESFQTDHSIARALTRAGFEGVRISRTFFFEVWAKKATP